MSLLKYILDSIKPEIYTKELLFAKFINSVCEHAIFTYEDFGPFDVVIAHSFDKNQMESLLRYDGFFICVEFYDQPNHECFYENELWIVKKSQFTPFPKKIHDDPIILRGSSIDAATIIKILCNQFEVQKYLELGAKNNKISSEIADGERLIVGVGKTIDAIDFSGSFYKMSNSDFFDKLKVSSPTINHPLKGVVFDLIFIDSTNFIAAKYDFENSLNFLEHGGTIVLYNTYNLNIYKLIEYIHKIYKYKQTLNIPIQPGLCIVRCI